MSARTIRLLDQNRETDVANPKTQNAKLLWRDVLKQPRVAHVYVNIRIKFIGTRSFFLCVSKVLEEFLYIYIYITLLIVCFLLQYRWHPVSLG